VNSAASPITLLVGLLEVWMIELARSGPELLPQRSLDWTNALDQLRGDGAPIGTAIIGALAAPVAQSLDDSQQALEAAVEANVFGPQQLLAALLPEMMARRSGRVLLVTWNPASQSRPQDAAARGSARGVLTYLESLRPALRQRGIIAGTLLISPRRMETWDAVAVAAPVAAAMRQCLQNGTPQRVLKVG
jgi:short-subunit dehydrogenase